MANKKQPAEMTVEDALRSLAGWHHSFVSEEGANRVARALGIQKPVHCLRRPQRSQRRSERTFDASRLRKEAAASPDGAWRSGSATNWASRTRARWAEAFRHRPVWKP